MAVKRGGSFSSSFLANADFGSAQYRFASGSGSTCALASSAGVIVGVIQNKPQSGKGAEVLNVGHTKIQLASSLGPNVEVMAGVSGFATQAQSGQWCGGFLINGANSGGFGELVVNIHKKGAY